MTKKGVVKIVQKRSSGDWVNSKSVRLPNNKIVHHVIKGIFPKFVIPEGLSDDEFPVKALGPSARCTKIVDWTRCKYAISKVLDDGTKMKVMTILWTQTGETTVLSDKTGNSLESQPAWASNGGDNSTSSTRPSSSDDPQHERCARNLFPKIDVLRPVQFYGTGALSGPSNRVPIPTSNEIEMDIVSAIFPGLDRAQCPGNIYRLPEDTDIICLLDISPPLEHYESSACLLHNKRSIHHYMLWRGYVHLCSITCDGRDGPAKVTYSRSQMSN